MPLARRCGADLQRFGAEIAVGAETDALDPRAEAITLLTLHAAKGLELTWCSWPARERPAAAPAPRVGPVTAAEAAEERRLWFVGMAWARERLLLSCAARRAQARRRAGGRPVVVAWPRSTRHRPGSPDLRPGCGGGRGGPPAAPALTVAPVTPAAWRRPGTGRRGPPFSSQACCLPCTCQLRPLPVRSTIAVSSSIPITVVPGGGAAAARLTSSERPGRAACRNAAGRAAAAARPARDPARGPEPGPRVPSR